MNYLRQFLVISVLFIGNSSFAQATPTETRLVVDQRPLTITLRKDHEHRLHFPEPVMIEVPDSLLTGAKVLQADGQVIYITPTQVSDVQRVIALSQDRDRFYLLDLRVSDDGERTDYRIEEASLLAAAREAESAESVEVEKPRNPAPVEITRYAAQALYGPTRLLPRSPAIRPMAAPSIANDLDLVRSQRGETFAVRAVAAWRGYGLHLVAIELQNLSPLHVDIDPRLVRGNWATVTAQHTYLGPQGSLEDRTTLYLVSRTPIAQTLEELAYGRY